MTSTQIRQSFLDFFRSKQHTIVPSSSLMPDSPNLLFTNAGMNQFVPIFLGERKADVSKWAGAVPSLDTRAADTQKCIRAGGKHNDLDDVGLDTYHHTFFEMLGNWSFGDYFKKDAIAWAWELVVEVWKFPPQRIYATIYQPNKAKNDPADRDQEAWELWAAKFRSVGLDPDIHIVNGGKKDNFWMMGETGPCGPCTEIHVDLRPGPRETDLDAQQSGRLLVNGSDARCIEIWNNVFIQYNANPDGTFSPLPAQHVDTGMGFERVTSIIQGTKNLTDFQNAKISNYETDVFRPLFDEIEKLCGKKYGSTLPKPGSTGDTEQEKVDVAFRVIADHIRTLSFAVADGIQPGNTDRNYVLRRILRRAVRYGRTLGFHEPFFYKLVDVLARTMGDVFPEIRAKQQQVKDVLKLEEESFNKTLDKGIVLFNEEVAHGVISAPFAFRLYDEQGFPLDLTELMARERGLTVDKSGFEKLMEEQRARARAAQKKEVISLSQIETTTPTQFVGFENLAVSAKVLEVVSLKDKTAVILDTSTCYAEMGGQVGDTGELIGSGQLWRVANTQKSGNTFLHFVEGGDAPAVGSNVTLTVEKARRDAIQRHHTVTHLLHWALHEVASKDASQKGSFVGPDKLTFDFNSAPLTPAQVADIEKLVNERILENAGVSWTEVAHADVKGRKDVMQFFGDKYGDTVRVVQIGGHAAKLDGYSMELCGGTHTRATGEIGLFRIVAESAIAAGVRRIEAVAGLTAFDAMRLDRELIKTIAGKVSSPVGELEKKIEAVLAHQKELEKQLKLAIARNASNAAGELLSRAHDVNGTPLIAHNLGDADGEFLQAVADALKSRFRGVIVLGGGAGGAVTLIASVSADFTAKVQAGKIIQQIAPIVGGKGGGKPDNARGGGKDATKLDEALAKVRTLLG
ncbi:MAG: alanine--tRNA ligase [Verrucomicrobia bacterium]|nr:alanine--tRNA ligase [Verrucomicrobiota bacterium]